ncbi:MAG: hypothetical protein K2W82_19275 [Candidatus Obscuribacterales bacterium]|nr:hypothetical protein [Candidatus Obscuribacterales bacterium]
MESNKNDWKLCPIPAFPKAASALDYHEIEINLESTRAQEPLVDVSQYDLATASYYARKDGLNPPYYKTFASASEQIFVRKTVAEKLVVVNKSLEPYQAELLLLDGYRPISLQKELWQHFINQAKLRLTDPTEEECIQFAGLYCSDPTGFDANDFRTWPTHATGGAVDLCLRSKDHKEPLYFGSIFDDAAEVSSTDYFEYLQRGLSSSLVEAKENRRLLYWAMTRAGFANFPYEWWHYDLGTQMWVMNSPGFERKAVYGLAELPAEAQAKPSAKSPEN